MSGLSWYFGLSQGRAGALGVGLLLWVTTGLGCYFGVQFEQKLPNANITQKIVPKSITKKKLTQQTEFHFVNLSFLSLHFPFVMDSQVVRKNAVHPYKSRPRLPAPQNDSSP